MAKRRGFALGAASVAAGGLLASAARSMTPPAEHVERYLDRIRALPAGELTRPQLMTSEFRLHHEGRFAIYYAPFDYVHRPAKVALVGITPGWQQMALAFRVARAQLAEGASVEQTLRAVKADASFAGMRRRMCGWLDELGLPESLGLTSSEELFGSGRQLLHTTSAVRYPVIRSDGENWSGSGPAPSSSSILRGYVHDLLAQELTQVDDALIVPLGAAVSKAMDDLVTAGLLDERRILAGFPHPSGLNTRGPAKFVSRRDEMRRQVRAWFGGGQTAKSAARPPTHPGRGSKRPARRQTRASRSPAQKAVAATALPGRREFEDLILRALSELGGRASRQHIKARALKLGTFSDAQLRVPPPTSKIGSYPNQVSYQLDWAMNALKSSGHIHSPIRTVWDLTATGRRRTR